MTWQPMDSAPKDGSMIIGHVSKAVWESGREDGPFIAAVRWDGSAWVLAEIFLEDSILTVSGWVPRGSQI